MSQNSISITAYKFLVGKKSWKASLWYFMHVWSKFEQTKQRAPLTWYRDVIVSIFKKIGNNGGGSIVT